MCHANYYYVRTYFPRFSFHFSLWPVVDFWLTLHFCCCYCYMVAAAAAIYLHVIGFMFLFFVVFSFFFVWILFKQNFNFKKKHLLYEWRKKEDVAHISSVHFLYFVVVVFDTLQPFFLILKHVKWIFALVSLAVIALTQNVVRLTTRRQTGGCNSNNKCESNNMKMTALWKSTTHIVYMRVPESVHVEKYLSIYLSIYLHVRVKCEIV